MKLIFRNNKLLFALTLLLAIMFTNCEESDSEKNIGFPKIYMPQATITGLDNSYPVPNGPFGESTSYNSFYKDGILNIALGVVRAGYIADAKGFSVNIEVSQDETNMKISQLEESGKTAIQIPSGIYQLPANVNVPAGSNTGTFYLSVNLRELANSSASLLNNDGWKMLVLAVKISNPTHYELSETNTSVVVIIDLNSEHWDNVAEDAAESEVRILFPML
jgi:hypothetical protein